MTSPGSLARGMLEEKQTGTWEARAAPARVGRYNCKEGRLMVARESDDPIVLGDGRADHKAVQMAEGKRVTRMRSPQRKHDAGKQDC